MTLLGLGELEASDVQVRGQHPIREGVHRGEHVPAPLRAIAAEVQQRQSSPTVRGHICHVVQQPDRVLLHHRPFEQRTIGMRPVSAVGHRHMLRAGRLRVRLSEHLFEGGSQKIAEAWRIVVQLGRPRTDLQDAARLAPLPVLWAGPACPVAEVLEAPLGCTEPSAVETVQRDAPILTPNRSLQKLVWRPNFRLRRGQFPSGALARTAAPIGVGLDHVEVQEMGLLGDLRGLRHRRRRHLRHAQRSSNCGLGFVPKILTQ
mmetsp:Transcript_43364/g.139353  ORF Transcript_43364/g.139353 Transcript_43364/m.139353 type:complete len:260 (-) Transcript_43364:242-1021(-)